MIPSASLDTTMIKFINGYYAKHNLTGDPVFTAIVTRPQVSNSDHYMVRIDEQLGGRDTLFFRYDRLNVTTLNPTSITADSCRSVPATNIGAGLNHLFSPSLIFDTRLRPPPRPFSPFR